jgi:hypothetical protein
MERGTEREKGRETGKEMGKAWECGLGMGSFRSETERERVWDWGLV